MADFIWQKDGPKPVSRKNTTESSWLVQSSIKTPGGLQVNFKAGSREFGLSEQYLENKISEVALKKKYA